MGNGWGSRSGGEGWRPRSGHGTAQCRLGGCSPVLAPLHPLPLCQPRGIDSAAIDSLFVLPPAETLMDSTTATAELGWTVHPPSGVSYPVTLPRAQPGVSLPHMSAGGMAQQVTC